VTTRDLPDNRIFLDAVTDAGASKKSTRLLVAFKNTLNLPELAAVLVQLTGLR
jgi:hypothetical protein